MYHPITQQALADSHRSDLLAEATRDRLVRASRKPGTHARQSRLAPLAHRLTVFIRLRHRPVVVAAATGMAAAAILLAGEL